MGLDIRVPIGLMFSILSPLLIVTGWLNNTSLNTYTGVTMGLFGGLFLTFGLLAQHRQRARAASRRRDEL